MEENNLVKKLDLELSNASDHVSKDSKRSEKKTKNKRKLLSGILATFGILILILGIGSYWIYSSLFKVGQQIALKVSEVQTIGNSIQNDIKNNDLGAVKTRVVEIRERINLIDGDLKKISWVGSIPVVSEYYNDANNSISGSYKILEAADIAISAISPYADIIGIKGISSSGDGAKTAQDRITFVVNTLDKVKPQIDEISKKIEEANSNISLIDENKYPEFVNGMPIRGRIKEVKLILSEVSSVINDAGPLIESAPYILGQKTPRKYLILFQNDAELRPTGGFLTGYAVINVDKGKISTVLSDDIYKLDEKFTKRIPAPEPIKKYHPNVPYWYLRDQNLSPDFKVSMETFLPNYKLTKSPEVDGVIAVSTQVLVDLLKITGPIGVPGYGNFSAETDKRCNCPNVFYELQLLAGAEEAVVWDSVTGKIVKAPDNYLNRKQFLGPVMYSVLANVMAQPKSKFPLLFETGINLIEGKHILAYFNDQSVQSAVENFNMAGRVRDTDPNSDYLMIVDTNFSGGKTNIWVKYKADQKIEVDSKGKLTKTVSITYDNPQEGSVKTEAGRRLNGLFRNWLRVYVPKGSKIIETKGFETGEKTSEDLGKTVFEGFFTLAPLNTKQITIKYELPESIKMEKEYKALIQKQGGTKNFNYTTTVNNKKIEEFPLDKDKTINVSL